VTPRLYCPMAIAEQTTLALPENAAHHAARVLRLEAGDEVTLFNGEGGEYRAELADLRGATVSVRVLAYDPVERETPLAVTLVQALVSSDRMDYAVQKAVELGAAAIQPIVTERTVGRLDSTRAAKRRSHWQNIVVSACEQCGRNRIPDVHELIPFADWLERPSSASQRWLFAPEAQEGLKALRPSQEKIEAMVGPEGGFTSQEVSAARSSGWHAVRLGPRVLRTESMGAAILAAINALWGDFA
jgi:16S rRNA (uracil1498-N3)-methyltransferase